MLESLTAILAPRTPDARVLDLFAGTGRVGLTLAEEGAGCVVFVEGSRKVAQGLRSIIKTHPLSEQLSLVVGAIPKILSRVQGTYDLIVCDPPYDWKEPETLLPAAEGLASPGCLLVVEHHHKTVYPETGAWSLTREEKFGETRLSFFELNCGSLAH